MINKTSSGVLNKLKSKGFKASKLSTYDFYTKYTTLHHHLNKDKFIDLIERTFSREHALYFSSNTDEYKNYKLWSCQNVCDALVYRLDNILLDLDLNFIDKL